MSDSVYIFVHYEKNNGETGTEKFINKQIHAACWLTRKKHGPKVTRVTGTTTRLANSADKCIPAPPEGWKYTRFKVNMKKNRFGRMVNGKVEVMDDFD